MGRVWTNMGILATIWPSNARCTSHFTPISYPVHSISHQLHTVPDWQMKYHARIHALLCLVHAAIHVEVHKADCRGMSGAPSGSILHFKPKYHQVVKDVLLSRRLLPLRFHLNPIVRCVHRAACSLRCVLWRPG